MDEQTTTTSRRKFLGTAAGATGVAIAATVWNTKQASAATAAEQKGATSAEVRPYVAGNFMLLLDGANTGFVKSVDGGAIYADVVAEPIGTGAFVKKHIGTPKYEDFALQIGLSMSKAVYSWIAASWNANYARKDGSIIAADYKLDAQSERKFYNALITETGIPACDGASKEPSYLTLKFAPEYVRAQKASGQLTAPTSSKVQKTWLPSNFRLEIDGLDCTKVNKVEAFTVKQSTATDNVGDSRDYQQEPGTLEFPNLKVTLAQTGAQTWYDYFNKFVVDGDSGEDNEKRGRLIFLSSDHLTQLARIEFFNMGIFKLSEDKALSNSDAIARVTAELYVERMEFHLGGELPS